VSTRPSDQSQKFTADEVGETVPVYFGNSAGKAIFTYDVLTAPNGDAESSIFDLTLVCALPKWGDHQIQLTEKCLATSLQFNLAEITNPVEDTVRQTPFRS
jgi:hypothetical protein